MKHENPELEWRIFKKALKGQLTDEERLMFDQWFRASTENQDYFNRAKSYYFHLDAESVVHEENYRFAWQEFLSYSRPSRKLSSYGWLMAAASIALLVALSVVLVLQLNKRRDLQSEGVVSHTVPPGRSMARLTIDGGETMLLGSKDTLISLSDVRSTIVIDAARMNYTAEQGKETVQSRINKVETPTGGEFHIILEDGTAIWLNAESTIEYPVPFPSDKREIILSGEAYVEVARHAEKPFIIKTNNMDVHALGTSFNISAYPNDVKVHTTLISGKVKIDNMSQNSVNSFILEPSQQFTYNTISKESSVNVVNTNIYTAWVSGRFMFEDMSLDEIFKMLGRWYGVEVQYARQEYREELFSGELPRFESLEIILEMMNTVSRLSFEQKGTTVIVQ